jgi:hypothetical protein
MDRAVQRVHMHGGRISQIEEVEGKPIVKSAPITNYFSGSSIVRMIVWTLSDKLEYFRTEATVAAYEDAVLIDSDRELYGVDNNYDHIALAVSEEVENELLAELKNLFYPCIDVELNYNLVCWIIDKAIRGGLYGESPGVLREITDVGGFVFRLKRPTHIRSQSRGA